MSFDYSTLITDRTRSDSDTLKTLLGKPMAEWTAEERTAFNGAVMRGSYDYTDLNRVDACMEDLVARLNRVGCNVPEYERVKIPRETKPAKEENFRYLRIIVNALRGNTTVFQVSEIKILSKTGESMPWPAETLVTSTMKETSEAESPKKLIDGSVETKFCSVHFSPGAQINIDLKSNILDRKEYTSWQWFTANDSPERDPVSFELLGSVDGIEFTALDSASSATITETRNTLAYSGSIGALPKGYTQVEHIQSGGTQYVNTLFAPNQDTRIELKCSPLSVADATDNDGFIPYGAGESYNSRAFECYTANGKYEFNYGNSNAFIGVPAVGQLLTIVHDKNKVSLTVNEETPILQSFSANTFTAPRNMVIFGIARATILCGKMRLYHCRIYDNNTFARDYIPCTNANGAVGLYDLIGQKFYGNAGSGSFTAGPVVTWDTPEEPAETLDPYTWYESDVPTVSLLARYRANVAAVRAVLRLPEGTPGVPETMRRLTVAEANSIETILLVLNFILSQIPAAVRHCGVTVCGSKGVRA